VSPIWCRVLRKSAGGGTSARARVSGCGQMYLSSSLFRASCRADHPPASAQRRASSARFPATPRSGSSRARSGTCQATRPGRTGPSLISRVTLASTTIDACRPETLTQKTIRKMADNGTLGPRDHATQYRNLIQALNHDSCPDTTTRRCPTTGTRRYSSWQLRPPTAPRPFRSGQRPA
jgi:hypothetical protein